MPPQLEKNHVVPTAWQDEALARDGVSREVPCSALKGDGHRALARSSQLRDWFPCAGAVSNQSILKEISPEYSLEGLMLKLNSSILVS